jgi:hypothetical protein
MFNSLSAPSRVSQRFTGARARRRALNADRPFLVQSTSSLGEALAVGLGCDGWKPRQS